MSGAIVFGSALALLLMATASYLILGVAADSRAADSAKRRQHAIDAFATVLFAEDDDVVAAFPIRERVERETLIEVVSTLPVHLGEEGRSRLRAIIDTPRSQRTYRRLAASRRWSTRIEAARLCGLTGSSEQTVRLLTDSHFAVRSMALQALSPRQVVEHAEVVANALLDPHPSVRTIAAAVLPSGGVAAVMPLNGILDHTSLDRHAALLAAGRISDRMLLGILRLHSRSDHPGNRVLAARALTNQSPSHAEPILLEMLVDTDPDVRSAAALGLGRIGTHLSMVPLRNLLSDPVWRVRMAAERALGSIGPAGSMLLRQQLRRRAELPVVGASDNGVPLPVPRERRVRI